MFAIRDINPQAPTHVLVIPVDHVASAAELDGGRRPAARPAVRGRRGDRPRRTAWTAASGWSPTSAPDGGQSVAPPPRPPARRAADGAGRPDDDRPPPRAPQPGAAGRRRGSSRSRSAACSSPSAAGAPGRRDRRGRPRSRPPTMAPDANVTEVTRGTRRQALEDAAFQVREPQHQLPARREPRPGQRPAPAGPGGHPRGPRGGLRRDLRAARPPTRRTASGSDFLRTWAAGRARSSTRATRSSWSGASGQTLVFFPWSVQASPDARVAELAAALETVGLPVGP